MNGGGPEAGCATRPATTGVATRATTPCADTATGAIRRPALTSRRHIDLLRTSSAA
ncbi:putative leader peptide [Streptomyces xiamenensis]|uniref:putative leader peptide n=1 Tax=Streptomyces xiamenensis TaxID=408015 RepID=UPI0035D64710